MIFNIPDKDASILAKKATYREAYDAGYEAATDEWEERMQDEANRN